MDTLEFRMPAKPAFPLHRGLGIKTLPLVAAIFLGGCSSPRHFGPEGRLAVCVAQAPIYENGPAQSTGPDLYLHRADRVTLVETKLGYSRVVTDAGFDGYIATRQLRPAPPEPAPVTPAPILARSTSPSIPRPEPAPGLDLFDVFTPSAPAPKTEPDPKPGFR